MKKTSIGLDENITALLCYLLGWISGLVLFLIEKENDTVRFHAMQSMVAFGTLTVIGLLFSPNYFPGALIFSIVHLAGIALWILLMIMAFQGELFRLPIIGDIAEDWVKKFSGYK